MPQTVKQVLAEQNRVPTKQQPSVPAVVAKPSPPAVPDNRPAHERYLDEIAPATIAGRMIKFNKEGKFIVADDETEVSEDTDFIALCDQTLIGWIKFNGQGEAPSREMGLLYSDYIMPPRESLGDTDPAEWEEGLSGQPADPWQHHVYLVLQRVDTGEVFTFVTSSVTGRRAIGMLLKHYDRMQKQQPGHYPLVRLKVGGFQHRDDRVGWVKTPVIAAIGRVPGIDAAKPESKSGEFNDKLPF